MLYSIDGLIQQAKTRLSYEKHGIVNVNFFDAPSLIIFTDVRLYCINLL